MSVIDDVDTVGGKNALVPIQISPTGESVICARMFTPPDDVLLVEYPPYHFGCRGFFMKKPEQTAAVDTLNDVWECEKCFTTFALKKGTRFYREVREQYATTMPKACVNPRMR